MSKSATVFVKGIVQGVGFRPFVYRLATRLSLRGFVLNSSSGVVIEVEGEEKAVDMFLESLPQYAPPLSNIEDIEITFHPCDNIKSFEIRESVEEEGQFILISADISICEDCQKELFSPADRRYKYPFINCTNCGPRFTIIRDIPYDREKTTMHKFQMCAACLTEYSKVYNRRYHAQPNACHKCGPSIHLLRGNGSDIESSALIQQANVMAQHTNNNHKQDACATIESSALIQQANVMAQHTNSNHKQDACATIESSALIQQATILLQQGNIIAIKGIGGFHLACDATNDTVVAKLRKRKGREGDKPFAIMSLNLEQVRLYCEVNEEEAHLLTSQAKPIVLLKKLPNCPISTDVAIKNNYLGVMLPYTPLHYLLLAEFQGCALIMTSGNSSDQPLIKDNQEAIEKLGSIADYLLVHNRDIHNRCDDSITRVINSKGSVIRRARGYAPLPISLKFRLGQILATGAELKNTFCLTKDNYAFISQHIGNLKNYETLNYYKESIEHFKRLFRITPAIIAHDLHPDYLSTRFAFELSTLNSQLLTFPIQHHHAHIASCMAENSVDEKVIGVAMDGMGYGTDGNIWGCEFLLTDYLGFERIGHLKYIPMPGGDKATEEPWRMAISYLYSVYGEAIPDCFFKRWGDEKTFFIIKMLKQGINSPLTSSAGRLFDAIASILGIRDVVDYEAQAAIELEMILYESENRGYGFEVYEEGNTLIIEPTKAILEIVHDIELGVNSSVISARFHNTVLGWTLEMCRRVRDKTGINKVALSGGVFQNRYLFERIKPHLEEEGFEVIFHSMVPANDGGISLGQAVIAARKLEG